MFAPGYRGNTNLDMPGLWSQPMPMMGMPMQSPMFSGGYLPPMPPAMNYAQTSIQPRQVYSPGLTKRAVNQGRASLARQFNPLALAKQFDRPGVSRGPQTGARLAPLMAQGFAANAALGPNLRFADDSANRQMMLQGQAARDQEAGQWGDLMSRGQDAFWQSNFGNIQTLLNLLSGFMGRIG